jgi:hypothetical protein
MNRIGRKIYYDKTSGNVLVVISEMVIFSEDTTIEQDIQNYTILTGRTRSSFDVIQLPFGELVDEFAKATSYRVNPATREIEFNYDPTFGLEQYKQFKLDELARKCENAIVGRFSSTVNNFVFQFSNDMEAQNNFKDGIWALENGKVASIPWTAYDSTGKVVRISLDLNQLSDINVNRLMHQQTNVSKLRDVLQPIVEAATTKEDVEAIVW